jgi:hypothetical protein
VDEQREQNLAEFLDTYGVDKAAEIVMYVLKPQRDTILLARLTSHLSKAQDRIQKARFESYANKYGVDAAKRAFKIIDW